METNDSIEMGVEELQAILESKDGILEGAHEIIYKKDSENDGEEVEETEEIVEIIEEIEEIVEVVEEVEQEEEEEEEEEGVEGVEKIDEVLEEEEDQEEQVEQKEQEEEEGEEHQQIESLSETNPESIAPNDSENTYIDEEELRNHLEESRENSINNQQSLAYDADEDWILEDTDPLETKLSQITESKAVKKSVTVNGNKSSSTTKPDNTYRNRELKIIRQESDNSPHEIVKNTENDLVYTVLGSKKSTGASKQYQQDSRYIKMERLEENTIPVEGTIYYEGDDMGTLYVAQPTTDTEQYQYAEQALEEEEPESEHGPDQENWEPVEENFNQEEEGGEGGEESNPQEQIFLHEDEDGQLYFKDENGTMQPVYLTEDGNYAIADNSSDDQDNHQENHHAKADSYMSVESEVANVRQNSSVANNDGGTPEDDTVTISLIISEDENGLKRTQVIIPTNDVLKCEICQKSFKSQFQLLRHNRLKHAREEDITTRNFPCDLCPKRFPDQNTLARHRKTHTGDRPFQCLECQETFPTAPQLRRHMSLHNPESKPLPCIYCGRRFVDKPALQKHEESHLAADMSMQKRNHDPDKKFDCEVCGREFNRLNNLQRHMLVHQQQGQNQEILTCDVCGITYKFMSSLTRHMVTSHMNPEKLRQQAEEQRRKRESNYKRYLENRKMYETQTVSPYGKRYKSGHSSDPDDDLA